MTMHKKRRIKFIGKDRNRCATMWHVGREYCVLTVGWHTGRIKKLAARQVRNITSRSRDAGWNFARVTQTRCQPHRIFKHDPALPKRAKNGILDRRKRGLRALNYSKRDQASTINVPSRPRFPFSGETREISNRSYQVYLLASDTSPFASSLLR